MNHVNVDRKRPCTGCFACSMVCPQNAISIQSDENGFFRPIVNNDCCTKCGLCKTICYSHLNEIPSYNGSLKAYYGWHKDDTVLKDSASGGITTAIATVFIEKGYSVIGCAYNSIEKKAEHIWISKKEDVYKLRGSKYFQSDLAKCIQLLKIADRKSKLLIFGTPCQILGIKMAMIKMKYDFSNIYFVELFCHGVVSTNVWRKYLLTNQAAGNAEAIRFRTKKYGWHIPCNEFISNMVSTPTKRVGDAFFRAFYSKDFFNRACYDCNARKNFGNADLRIGDFWGKRFIKNKTGVSCIITAGERGAYILGQCCQEFSFHEIELQEVLAGQSCNETYPFDEDRWNRAYAILCTKSFHKVLFFINAKYPLAQRIKNQLYTIGSNLKHDFIDK